MVFVPYLLPQYNEVATVKTFTKTEFNPKTLWIEIDSAEMARHSIVIFDGDMRDGAHTHPLSHIANCVKAVG